MALKSTELRIGNIVWDDYSGEMIVSVIHENGFVSLKKTHLLPSGLYDCDRLEGIPVTEDRLAEFGFELIKNDNPSPSDWIWVHSKLDGCFWNGTMEFSKNKTYYKFVHQLQNLYFALTGEELQKN